MVVVALSQSLRFARDAAGRLTATQVALDARVDAPPRIRAEIEALQAPYRGAAITIVVGDDGTPGAVIDAAASWARMAASFVAFDRHLAEDPAVTAEARATARAIADAQMPRTPAEQKARLRETVALFLPPPLPALETGETRPFTTMLAGPTGPLAAAGTIMLAREAAGPVYRMTVASDRAAGAAAAATLRAGLSPATPPAERARIEATAAALATARLTERAEIAIDPATGLLARLHSVRMIDDGSGPPRLIAERLIEAQP